MKTHIRIKQQIRLAVFERFAAPQQYPALIFIYVFIHLLFKSHAFNLEATNQRTESLLQRYSVISLLLFIALAL